MIISHKYRFIFIRPVKVAGSSVQLSMGCSVGKYDTISRSYRKPHNNGDVGCDYFYENLNNNNLICGCHRGVKKIIKDFGKYYFDNYKKVSIVRNPWDVGVSFFWFSIRDKIKNHNLTFDDFNICKKEFNKFILYRRNKKSRMFKSGDFYFLDGKCVIDYVLKFENLENDYRDFCSEIGIEYIKPPRAKGGLRLLKNHYSEYYDEEAKKLIEEKNRKIIDFFGYKFEEKSSSIISQSRYRDF